MIDPRSYRPAPGTIPTDPGVYRFLDPDGRVIYVGKAKNLRNRLNSYFAPLDSLMPKVRRMVTAACAVKWVVVNDELEALSLEYAWIKEFQPFFNIMYRDDKSYPYLALTLGDTYPRMQVTRERKRRHTRYYGPYTQVWAIRETMDLLRRAFPLRNCSSGVFFRAHQQGRPCLQGYIEKCCAPCVGRVSEREYGALVNSVQDFLDGKDAQIIAEVREKMQLAAEQLEFEKAGKYRDQLQALETVLAKNTVVLDEQIDADIFAAAADELEMAVQVFYVRAGRIRGERGWIVDRGETESEADLWAQFLQQCYGGYPDLAEDEKTGAQMEAPTSVDDVSHRSASQVPSEIWIPQLPADKEVLERWLYRKRGAKVRIYKPQRGNKARLVEMVRKNAELTLERHRIRRIGDLSERAVALQELCDYLELPTPPLRIEGYDISHTQGTHQVGSMVVFEDGAPNKRAYRSFKIRENGDSADDTAALREVLERRFRRLAEEKAALAETLQSGAEQGVVELPRFSYRPDLLVIDGGLPQVNAAAQILAEIGEEVPVVGLAKRMEEIWIPGENFPLILPRQSRALYLMQALRDESHRFAIKAHRNARGKSMKKSALDQVPGLGPHRQKLLLKHFGSVKQIRQASVDEIQAVKGIGKELSQVIHDSLNR